MLGSENEFWLVWAHYPLHKSLPYQLAQGWAHVPSQDTAKGTRFCDLSWSVREEVPLFSTRQESVNTEPGSKAIERGRFMETEFRKERQTGPHCLNYRWSTILNCDYPGLVSQVNHFLSPPSLSPQCFLPFFFFSFFIRYFGAKGPK